MKTTNPAWYTKMVAAMPCTTDEPVSFYRVRANNAPLSGSAQTFRVERRAGRGWTTVANGFGSYGDAARKAASM